MNSIKPPKKNSIRPSSKTFPAPHLKKPSLKMEPVSNGVIIISEGICPVCRGRVVEGSEVFETHRGHKQEYKGIHCTKCGIKFEFIPPKRI